MYAGALRPRSAATAGPAANTANATAASNSFFIGPSPIFLWGRFIACHACEKYERNAAFRYKKAISADQWYFSNAETGGALT